ncbi:MAG: NAD(P)-dependent oxidoreductase [Caldilineaceae bacterium]
MNRLPTIGFIGLGAMGGAMARNLLAAGYPLAGFDLKAELTGAIAQAGGQIAASVVELVENCAVICTSLPSSQAWVTVAETEILPHVRPGQVLIDFGTVTPPETRRLAVAFAEKGAALIDAPVSGGPGGAQKAALYCFVGGEPAIVAQMRPLLETVAGSEMLTYCGPAGCGQVVKGVNQLMMGLADAAYLEALSFGVNSGVDAAIIEQALGNTGRWRADINRTAQRVVAGEGEKVGVKFRELPYFLRAAEEAGFALPLTERLHAVCDAGERVVIDDNRPAPSFWRELTGEEWL